MKIIIAGSRNFNDYQKLHKFCDNILQDQTNIEIVSGTYKGADQLGEHYAAEKGFPITQFPPDWKRYRKAAGYKRNEQMAAFADTLIAFWDGKSKGTKHMVDLAKSSNLKILICYY